jgi:hypothetical protein
VGTLPGNQGSNTTFHHLTLIDWRNCSFAGLWGCTLALFKKFRELLVFLNARVSDVLPSSHNTIRNWVMETFDAQRLIIVDLIKKSSRRSIGRLIFGRHLMTSQLWELLPTGQAIK